jgi:small subunit ribosomal protein S4e
MVKRHLKRFATPKTWKIKKKGITFITRPNPGSHPIGMCMPISVVMKQMLKSANTTKEVRKLLYNNEVLVDGRRVKDHRFPVGLMDVITLTPTKQNFRVVLDEKGHLAAIEIDANEAKLKLCRIVKKTLLKGAKMQLNMSDSRNIIVDKGEYSLGDSLLIEIPTQKIAGQFKLEKGAEVLLIAGKHIAEEGAVESAGKNRMIFKNKKGESVTTSKKYAFVVGKEKPAIKIK